MVKRIIGVILILAIAGCAALTEPEYRPPFVLAPVPAGKSILYVYRVDKNHIGYSADIWLNSKEQQRLTDDTYQVFVVDPGTQIVETKTTRLSGQLADQAVYIDTEEGQYQFVRLSFGSNLGYFVGTSAVYNYSVRMRKVPKSTALQELRYVYTIEEKRELRKKRLGGAEDK